MSTAYIRNGYLRLKRNSYNWGLVSSTIIILKRNIELNLITYEEYQDCVLLLLMGGYINEENISM